MNEFSSFSKLSIADDILHPQYAIHLFPFIHNNYIIQRVNVELLKLDEATYVKT